MDDDKFADFGVLSIYKPERFLLISNNEQQTGRLDQSLSFVSLFLEGAQVTKRISVAETDVKHVKRVKRLRIGVRHVQLAVCSFLQVDPSGGYGTNRVVSPCFFFKYSKYPHAKLIRPGLMGNSPCLHLIFVCSLNFI